MMVAITFIAFHSHNRNWEATAELEFANRIHVSLVQSLRQFDAAQIAMLRFRETNDQKFAQEAIERLKMASEETMRLRNYMRSQDVADQTRALVDMFLGFAKCCMMEIDVGEALKRIETENREETDALRREQQGVRQELDKIVDDIVKMSEALLDVISKRQEETKRYMDALTHMTLMTLTAASIVAVVGVIVIGFVVVQRVNREAVPTYSEGFEGVAPSTDMRVVADRLQEVVNLLRKG